MEMSRKTKQNKGGEAAVQLEKQKQKQNKNKTKKKKKKTKRAIKGFISQLMRGLMGCNDHCACPTSSTLNALNGLLELKNTEVDIRN